MPKYASCEVLILDDTSSIYIFHSQGIGTRSARESAGPPTSTNSSRHDVVDDDDRVKIVYGQEMDSYGSVTTDSDSTDSEVDTTLVGATSRRWLWDMFLQFLIFVMSISKSVAGILSF